MRRFGHFCDFLPPTFPVIPPRTILLVQPWAHSPTRQRSPRGERHWVRSWYVLHFFHFIFCTVHTVHTVYSPLSLIVNITLTTTTHHIFNSVLAEPHSAIPIRYTISNSASNIHIYNLSSIIHHLSFIIYHQSINYPSSISIYSLGKLATESLSKTTKVTKTAHIFTFSLLCNSDFVNFVKNDKELNLSSVGFVTFDNHANLS